VGTGSTVGFGEKDALDRIFHLLQENKAGGDDALNKNILFLLQWLSIKI
jgi:hypothetical protein